MVFVGDATTVAATYAIFVRLAQDGNFRLKNLGIMSVQTASGSITVQGSFPDWAIPIVVIPSIVIVALAFYAWVRCSRPATNPRSDRVAVSL